MALREIQHLEDLIKIAKVDFKDIQYLGVCLTDMSVNQLRTCLTHSITVGIARGIYDKSGKLAQPTQSDSESVVTHIRDMEPPQNINPDSLCPCGSGRRYKKCGMRGLCNSFKIQS